MRNRKARRLRVVRLSPNGVLGELEQRFLELTGCRLRRALLGRRDIRYNLLDEQYASVWLRAQLPCGRIARRCDYHLRWGMR